MPTSPLPTHLARLLECIECFGRFGEPQLQLIIIMETCGGVILNKQKDNKAVYIIRPTERDDCFISNKTELKYSYIYVLFTKSFYLETNRNQSTQLSSIEDLWPQF